MFKLTASRQTSQSPNRQLRQWHSTASPEELGPWDHKICGEITKDSKRSRICPRKGKGVLTPQMRFEEMQEGTLACCLAFLGLLLSFFSRELAALIPYSAGANLPQEAQRPQKCRFPWSLANKMVGNTQGLNRLLSFSSAATYSCCSTSMTQVKSSFRPIPVKDFLWTMFSVHY